MAESWDETGEAGRLFVGEALRRLQEIEHALAHGIPAAGTPEHATLVRHTHSLKGTAGSLGHERIESLAAELNTQLAQRREGQPAPEEAALLTREFGSLRKAIEELTREASGHLGP